MRHAPSSPTLPVLVILWYLVGAIRRAVGRGTLRGAKEGGTQHVRALSWQRLEILLESAFRGRGFKVRYQGGSAPDGGVDLVLKDADGTHLVQAKHWHTRRVGVGPLRDLAGVVAARGAVKGWFVSSGELTQPALDFATQASIRLLCGDELVEWLRGAEEHEDEKTPGCSECGRNMVQRKAH